MLSLCQGICQIVFTSKLVTLFIIYPGAAELLPYLLLLLRFFRRGFRRRLFCFFYMGRISCSSA